MAACFEEKGTTIEDQIDLSSTSEDYGFAKKVFGLVAAQILVTVLIILPFVLIHEFKNFAREYQWVYSIFLLVFLFLFVTLLFWKSARQKHPWNLIVLDFFTVFVALSTGFSSAKVEHPCCVFSALAFVCCLCAFNAMLAFKLKLNVISTLTTLMFVVWFLLFILIVVLFWFENAVLNLIIISGFILGYSLFVVIIIQTTFNNQQEYYDHGRDYVLAVMCIYASVILIWEHILKLCASLLF